MLASQFQEMMIQKLDMIIALLEDIKCNTAPLDDETVLREALGDIFPLPPAAEMDSADASQPGYDYTREIIYG